MGRHSIFNFEIWISFFFSNTRHPRKTDINLSAWLNISTCNRPFANERPPCWTIAFIYFIKNLLSCSPHNCIWNNELKCAKDTTCERMWTNVNSANHKYESVVCVFFLSPVPRCERKSWIKRAVALWVQTRCADVKPLWEWKREDAVELNHSRCFQMTDLIWYFVWIYLLI